MDKEREMKLSARHWNGNQVCSIDIETTGNDPLVFEIIQVAILPLDAAFKPRKDVMPYYVNITPEFPNVWQNDKGDWNKDEVGLKKFRLSRSKLAAACLHGFDSEAAKEMLYNWIGKLKLPCTRYGKPKLIFPLGHNYAHDRAFLCRWLGQDNYEEFFGTRVLDTMVSAQYLNDRADLHNEVVPYSKTDLSWLARIHSVDAGGRHDALCDARITAEVYRLMCLKGLF